jgi:hypothetical protein
MADVVPAVVTDAPVMTDAVVTDLGVDADPAARRRRRWRSGQGRRRWRIRQRWLSTGGRRRADGQQEEKGREKVP